MYINWKKTLTIAVDTLLAAYLVLAVSAFNTPDQASRVCTKVNIDIEDKATNGFIDVHEIKHRLEQGRLYPLSKPMRYVDARRIEETLRQSPFVNTAECFKTEDGYVNISVTQRMPIVRVKADNGDDYYLDDNNCIMPNSHYTSDLIIATGNISRWFATNYISPLAKSLMANDLWKNLVEQINVTTEKGIEIVPRVGNHVVYIGRMPQCNDRQKRQQKVNDFINGKLTRLEKFYKYGLSQAGWNKYSYINLEFDNQIICKKRPGSALSQ